MHFALEPVNALAFEKDPALSKFTPESMAGVDPAVLRDFARRSGQDVMRSYLLVGHSDPAGRDYAVRPRARDLA